MIGVSHPDGLILKKKRVFYTGSDALVQGQGLCYDFDRGTATTAEPSRRHYVEKPSATNNLHFAGVTASDYSAVTGGQWIEIYEPGSTCYVAAGINTTLGTTYLTCVAGGADPGRWRDAGFMGRGTALALQTKAAVQLAGETDGTGVLDAAGTTLTGTGFVTGGVAAGDKVVIYGGEHSGDGDVTDGIYTVSSVTNATTLVLTSAACSAELNCSYYIYTGNPLVLAHLFDGEESGLVEFPYADNGALTITAGGCTYFDGYINLSDHGTIALADGKYDGMKKKIRTLNASVANDIVATLATTGIQADGSTALDTLTFDEAADVATLQWDGCWRELYSTGVAKA